MDDVTNYINNVGKPLEEQVFHLSVSYRELLALKAFLQDLHPSYLERNLHPSYLEHSENVKLAVSMFETLKQISDYAQMRKSE